jgi:hypothetical protein
MKNKLSKLYDYHRWQMEQYDGEKSEYMKRNGAVYCDYFVHLLRMSEYYRGYLNAIIELQS